MRSLTALFPKAGFASHRTIIHEWLVTLTLLLVLALALVIALARIAVSGEWLGGMDRALYDAAVGLAPVAFDIAQVQHASSTQVFIVTAIMLVVLMMGYLRFAARATLALSIAMAVAALAVAWFLLHQSALWLSPVVPMSMALLACPLWRWRRLEAVQRDRDAELAGLAREPTIAPQALAQAMTSAEQPEPFTLEKATQRLRDLNRFVADDLEGRPEAVLVSDARGYITLANASARHLFQRLIDAEHPRMVKGHELFELLGLLALEERRGWHEIWRDACQRAVALSRETSLPDGRTFLVRFAPCFSARGAGTGSVVTLADVSAMRECERRCDEAMRLLSHDLRSPQASILTLLDMYRHEPAAMPVEKLIERVAGYARDTLSLIDDFLRLAQAECVRVEDFQILDLADLLRDAIEDAWPVSAVRSVRIQTLGSGEGAWVAGDRDLLTRLFLTLLSNAVSNSAVGATVTVTLSRSASADDGAWQVAVADRGGGASSNDISHRLTASAEASANNKQTIEEAHEESGIELAVAFVKTVVARHGGRITVQNHDAAGVEDQGAVFMVVLPAVEPPRD